MSDTKFTKGPWLFCEGADNFGYPSSETLGSIMSGDMHIARIWADGDNPNDDAHLIAAAPDMYEMLADITASGIHRQRIDAILAKARGETTTTEGGE